MCMRCGMVPETMQHAIFECNDKYYEEKDLLNRLGFTEEGYLHQIVQTKRLREHWERETCNIR